MENMDTKELESAVEGILFASGEPIQTDRICLALSLERAEVETILRRLRDYYAFERRGMRLLQMEDRWQLCSSPDHAEVIRKAFEIRKPAKLSQPALEALTIIAYYQPTTRAYVDKLRGVDSAYTVGLLLERGLIETCGNLQAPGRPLLYRTTEKFLRSFHISSLDELPPLNEDDAPPQQLRIEDMAQRLTESPEAVANAPESPEAAPETSESMDAAPETAQTSEAAPEVAQTSDNAPKVMDAPQVADMPEEEAEIKEDAIPAREMMLAGYPQILTAPRRVRRKPAPRKPKRLAATFRTRRKRPGRKRKRRRTARPGREAPEAESCGNAPEFPTLAETYGDFPEVSQTYDEMSEIAETYDEIPEVLETYDEFPEMPETYAELPQVRAASRKDRRKRPARKIKRLAGTFRPRKRRKRGGKPPLSLRDISPKGGDADGRRDTFPKGRDADGRRDTFPQGGDADGARDIFPKGGDADGKSGQSSPAPSESGTGGGNFPSASVPALTQAGASRRGLSAKAARRCLHCMLCGLWLSWPFCSF